MKILVSGPRGFVGSALVPRLEAEGHEVWGLSRRTGTRTLVWNPAEGILDRAQIRGFDAVVHLAGENIAGRWTRSKLQRIRISRLAGTRLLAEACAASPQPPATFVMASAVGYYGSRGDEELTEESPRGDGLLAGLCEEWESETAPLGAGLAIRVVKLRLGVVLSPEGGALRMMLPAFRIGVGGKLGNGRHWFPWVTREDAVRVLHQALHDSSMGGVYNTVAPAPVRNDEFTQLLAQALGRPVLLPVPAFALRLAFGRMADEALLTSQRVLPARLLSKGFRFTDPELGPALQRILRT